MPIFVFPRPPFGTPLRRLVWEGAQTPGVVGGGGRLPSDVPPKSRRGGGGEGGGEPPSPTPLPLPLPACPLPPVGIPRRGPAPSVPLPLVIQMCVMKWEEDE